MKTPEEKINKLIGISPAYYRDGLVTLQNRLDDYNKKNGTDFNISHNGLELWIFVTNELVWLRDEETFKSLKNMAQESGFLNAYRYGNRTAGLTLGDASKVQWERDQKINKILN